MSVSSECIFSVFDLLRYCLLPVFIFQNSTASVYIAVGQACSCDASVYRYATWVAHDLESHLHLSRPGNN